MYKNLAATPVAACFVAPVFFLPAVSPNARKGAVGSAAGTPMPGLSLLLGVQDGFTP